jgi:hypothetical protein
MKQFSLLDKLAAILWRDLLTAMRYPAAFWMQALTMILEIRTSRRSFRYTDERCGRRGMVVRFGNRISTSLDMQGGKIS